MTDSTVAEDNFGIVLHSYDANNNLTAKPAYGVVATCLTGGSCS